MRCSVRFKLFGTFFYSEEGSCLDQQSAIDLAERIEWVFPSLQPVAGRCSRGNGLRPVRCLVKFKLFGKLFCSEEGSYLDQQSAIDLAERIEGSFPSLQPVVGRYLYGGGWRPIASPRNPTVDTRNLYDGTNGPRPIRASRTHAPVCLCV